MVTRSSVRAVSLLVLLASVVGCGNKTPPRAPDPDEQETEEPEEQEPTNRRPRPDPGATSKTPPRTEPKAPPRTEPPADEEWGPGKAMGQALTRVAAMAKKAEEVGHYGFDKEHACFLGAFIRKGASVDMTQEFMGGVKYAILGAGSASALDVDLGIFDSNGKSVAVDVDNDPSPIIEFTLPASGTYKFVLKLQNASTAGSFVAAAIMRQGNGAWTIPADRVTQSFGSLLGNARLLAQTVKKQGNGDLYFHEQGDWSFYGGVLTPGWSNTFRNLHLRSQPTVVIGGGDSHAADVDIKVKDETEGDEFKDTDNDATPMVAFRPKADHKFTLKVINEKSDGPSLITVAILDSEK